MDDDDLSPWPVLVAGLFVALLIGGMILMMLFNHDDAPTPVIPPTVSAHAVP